MNCIHGNDPQEYCRRCEREIKRAEAFEAMREALIRATEYIVEDDKDRDRRSVGIAIRAALALADKIVR